MRVAVALVLLVLVTACRHPLEIVGQGDIVSLDGLHDCTLENQPCDNLIEGEYRVRYSAVPRPGWRFARWEGCSTQFPDCELNVSAAVVAQFEGQTTPPLRAVFEPLDSASPNILVIMADDLGYNDLAINNGNTAIHTPNMDAVARQGVLFKRHYAAPTCSPARASFLTGMVPERLGFIPDGGGISPQVITLPERLQQEGYTTWHIGKWHIGDTYREAWPDEQGFDHWFGFLNQWRLAGAQADGEIQLVQPRYEDPWLEGSEGPSQYYTGHLENILADKAIEVLTDLEAEGNPWFLNLWFYAPHSPISPAPEFAANYPDTDDGRYRALINQLDYNIGRVVDHLDAIGAANNTILIIVSDNGGARNRTDNNDNNAPFAGFKATLSEGGLRTPLMIRWPAGMPAGLEVSDTVSIEDIYPTLLESIGVYLPSTIDGHSFYQSVQGTVDPVERPLFWEQNAQNTSHGALTADGRWRLEKPVPFWGVDLGPYLYDLLSDPTATLRVEPMPPEVVEGINTGYQEWFRDVHVADTYYMPGGSGTGVLSGDELQRTPGFGYFTFGIGIPDNFQGQIASQAGAWSLTRNADTVTASFGEYMVSGELDGVSACQSVVVTAYFARHNSAFAGPDAINLALYINGQQVQTLVVEGAVLQADDIFEGTVIGDPGVPGNDPLGTPVILNRALDSNSAWTVESFSDELCPQV